MFPEHATLPEKEAYLEWRELCGWLTDERKKRDFPYKSGDILKVDNRPYSNIPAYYVYLENVFKKNSFGILSCRNIFSDGGLIGCYGFLPCHIEVVPSCPDNLFNKLAYIVRKKGDEALTKMFIIRT